MTSAEAQGSWQILRRLLPIVASIGVGGAIGTYSPDAGSLSAIFVVQLHSDPGVGLSAGNFVLP